MRARGLAACGFVLALACGGCVDRAPASDVRGNYDISYDDQLTLKLKIGGAVREATGSESDTVTFEGGGQPVTLDLAEFCGREEVQCPSETLWAKVAVDQPNIDAANPNTHVINVVNNTERELPDGVQAEVVSGLVDAQDRFGMVLGGGSKSNGDCALLAISTAGGRFTHEGETTEPCPVPDAGPDGGADAGDAGDGEGDAGLAGAPCVRVTWPDGAAVDGMADGEVKLGFLGACAFGPALIGATLEIKTGFTGARTGADAG
jgi:hypothetical protein